MTHDTWTAHEIRRAFIDFFVARAHTEVPSAPLVPRGDPTLLFTSAGMVQFKELYLHPLNLPYTRAASVQKCLRAGDLESVGKTLRHHTFFEMLGNFSFGDYFKREAIEWAWEFVIHRLHLPQDKLSVSVFEDDDEAFGIWNGEIRVPASRIVRLGRRDNFWGPVGKTGICGPCSEIYYDSGPERGCGKPGCTTGCDCDRYIEFWNLVFPQFFLDENGTYRPLEKPGIDTGLGLERLAMILQGVEDNFHTDLFHPVVEALLDMFPEGMRISHEDRMGINMVADHARALTFTVAEGIYPSNEGRGYLVRRLLRRALTKFYSYGIAEPFLYRLVDVVVNTMKIDYPELEERRDDVAAIVRGEEESFFRTLEDGKARFVSIVREAGEANAAVIDGERAFLLHDTYGFPLELTKTLAAAEGLTVDEDGFEAAMEEQRRRAHEGSSFAGEGQEMISMNVLAEGESSRFVGYERLGGEAIVRSWRLIERSSLGDVEWSDPEGYALELILDETPFYATSGGQVADGGWIEIAGRRLRIMDVFKRGGEIVHLVESPWREEDVRHKLTNNQGVRLQVEDERRLAVARNHTATHLLHAALREIVGRHVAQAGSLVGGERLRFDFNHYQGVEHDALRRIEDRVNGWIRDCLEVRTESMNYQDAVDAGVIALFGEKYGKEVRVVRIGDVSAELCGGTHLSNTGQIGLFLIASEGGVAAGVRRIEALTGTGAIANVRELADRNEELAAILKVSRGETNARARALVAELDELRRELKRAESGEAAQELDRIISSAVPVDGILVAYGRLTVKDIGALRNQADVFRGKVKTGIAVLSAELNEKLQFVIAVSDDLVETRGIGADALVRELGPVVGGGGGGKKHLAQLGTRDLGGERKVFEVLPGIVKKIISR
ncbi:MAG: alanine--tRNA ligase [Candidatus Krumholzibacteria bacterium]|nr:alanine--tRNA ligase [Candidatus Krumholzibacteria bacterium]